MGFEATITAKHNNLDELVEAIRNGAKHGVEIASKVTAEEALELKRGSHDKDLILAEQKEDGDTFIGRVYTNFPYATFLEYGTGVYSEFPAEGDNKHIGTTYTFHKSGMNYWYLPVNKAKRKLNNEIVLIKKRDKAGNLTGEKIECYLMFATEPFPFMRPTALYTRYDNCDAIKNAIKEAIGGLK